ncbi:MAG: hypothetical protein ABEJ75_02395 [Candidatus Nanohaloarchaea archaeon]
MKKLAAAVTLVLLTGTVAGFTAGSSRALNLEHLPQYAEEFNNNTAKLPGIVRSLIGDQRINVEITRQGREDLVLGVVMKGVKIARINDTRVENPTLEVNTSMKTVESILNSANPARTLRAKLESGAIDYRVHGAFNRLKFFFLRIFAGF